MGVEPRSPAFLVPMPLPTSHGCQWQDLNFYPYKLSDLKLTPFPSLHVDLLYPTCCYLVIFVCVLIIRCSYHYTIHQFVNKCRFYESTLLNYAYPCRNWTFQRFARAAQKKGRNETNKKSDTRWESNPGPRLFKCRCYNHQATGSSGRI